MTTPMTPEEQADLIDYATKFGHSIGNRYPRLRDDLVGASLLGAAEAFASDRFPGDPEARRKFLGTASWNMIRRELQFFFKKQPISFTDLGADIQLDEEQCHADPHHEVSTAWRDEFEAIAATLEGKTTEIFRLAFGDISYTNAAIGREVGVRPPCVNYHLTKIRRTLRSRHAKGGPS